jgi:hypothetical protein
MEPHLALAFPFMPYEGLHFIWVLGFLVKPPYPLGFPIKGGGEELSTLTLSRHTQAMLDLGFSLPPREIVS